MAEKDILEKQLENKKDVFADILNVYRFHGKQVVAPEKLNDLPPRSMTTAHGEIHDQERDVLKFWNDETTPGVFQIGRFGLENQTVVHPYMAFRVIGYDGATYHEQSMDYDNRYRQAKKKLEEKKKKGEVPDEDVKVEFTPVPVWSYVLYFGLTPWNASQSLSGIFDMSHYPKELQDDFYDYGYKVIQVAFSTKDEIKALTSDFRYVAKALVEYRELCEKRGTDVRELDLTKLKEALDADFDYPYEVSNLILAILRSSEFGRSVEKRLKEGGCKVIDYVEKYAEEYAANKGALAFWESLYNLTESEKISENEALEKLDPTGRMRAMYPRPADFPDCFKKSA